MRHLFAWDADAGVADAKLHRPLMGLQTHFDGALQSELEGVRHEVEDDLLPHVAVDVDRLLRGRAIHLQREAGPLARRAEAAGELPREHAEIDWLEARAHAPRLETGEVQQGVDELQQPQAVAERGVDPLALLDGKRRLAVGERILEGSYHERERRAKFVAHIAEESRLGA